MDGSNVFVVLLCVLKIVNIRAQCEKPSIGDNIILTPQSDKSSYPDGSTATFMCSVGFRPVDLQASKSITCNGNMWTNLALQCRKKSCGALAEISNGWFSFSPEGDDGILFGATATAHCNEGYLLYGYNKRRCMLAGWDGRNPVCEVVKCIPPPDIENGYTTEPLEEVYGYESAVTYACNKDYFMSGEASISCMANGTFPSPPQCKQVDCGELKIDPNSQRSGARPPYKLSSFVEFQCNSGYTLRGPVRLVCGKSGWDGSPPDCIALPVPTRQPTKATPRTTSKPRATAVPPHPTPDPHNNSWKIALGVGIPLAVLALISGWCYYKKKSSRDHPLPHPKP